MQQKADGKRKNQTHSSGTNDFQNRRKWIDETKETLAAILKHVSLRAQSGEIPEKFHPIW